jgi:glucosamine 6-phosphate synthetase-like amidotransferase/phosphosugar isomerase protein
MVTIEMPEVHPLIAPLVYAIPVQLWPTRSPA